MSGNDCQGEDPLRILAERLRNLSIADDAARWEAAGLLYSLQERVEELEKALEPFAVIVQDDEMDGSFDQAQVDVRLGDLRRARAALRKDQL